MLSIMFAPTALQEQLPLFAFACQGTGLIKKR